MAEFEKKSIYARFDEFLWNYAGVIQFLQAILLIFALSFAGIVYTNHSKEIVATTLSADSVLDSGENEALDDLSESSEVIAEEDQNATTNPSSSETPDVGNIHESQLEEIDNDLAALISKLDSLEVKLLQESDVGGDLKKLVEQMQEKNQASFQALEAITSESKEVLGKENKDAIDGLKSLLIEQIEKPVSDNLSQLEVALQESASDSGNSIKSLMGQNEKFEKKVEQSLGALGDTIEGFDLRMNEYEEVTNSWREQLQRYAASNLGEQHSTLLLCDSNTLPTELNIRGYFTQQKLQHPLQFKNYKFSLYVARGGAMFPPEANLSGDVDDISFDGLVTKDGSGKKCLLDLFNEDQAKRRLVLLVESNAMRQPPDRFRQWCDENKVEVNTVVLMQSESSAAQEDVKQWTLFCQNTGGQLSVVYLPDDDNADSLSSVKQSLFNSIQRALYPVVDSSQ